MSQAHHEDAPARWQGKDRTRFPWKLVAGRMSEGTTLEIDVLEALGTAVDDLLAALEQADASSAYLDGQRAFFQAVGPAVERAGESERPQVVLEQVASGLAVELEDGRLQDPPLDRKQAGVLAAWGICIGYVEGFPAGARTVIEQVNQTPGVTGSFEAEEGD